MNHHRFAPSPVLSTSPITRAKFKWNAAVGAVVVAVLSLATLVPAQRTWTQVNPRPAAGPSVRQGAAMAYDSARDVVVLFGGGQQGPGTGGAIVAVFADTWEWDGITWTQRFPTWSPAARYGAAMAYDSLRGRTVLFAGWTSSGNSFLNDTWEWDGTTWIHVPHISAPPAGYEHAMAFDAARGRTMLFSHGSTYEWDGIIWRLRRPATSPPDRYRPAMAFDSLRDRLVLFSGNDNLADTWEWDGTDWTELIPATSPQAREFHAMTFDAGRGRVLLFGGDYSVQGNKRYLGDTWEWDGINWSPVSTPTSPAARSSMAMAVHARRGRAVLFGGASGANDLDDTWEFIQPFAASFSVYGAGCPGTAGIPTLSAATNSLPWIGSTFTARLDNIGSHPLLNVPLMLVGFSRTNWGLATLPLDLSSYGMTGCFLLAEPALAFTLANRGGWATWDAALPNDPSIAGASLFAQGGTTSFGANALGVVLSNAGEIAIGAR